MRMDEGAGIGEVYSFFKTQGNRTIDGFQTMRR